ncbi:ankyrin repeat domain-containing protein [Aspergillus homomorphus CBS 101889]|uniref:Ankyrin n=1 Tax=Aspergillus homomorphus (strain CBS 101889) TaxID=1450537 RepID=A0A395I620_ASPHC|nr:ankyrin [Aspergillus homomorphus CBS 101889]RAL15199.1 ankyrin [Aspergillus homomorphus CBS 101889]
MVPIDAFVDAFHDACFEGNLSETQKALASGRLSTEDLDEALNLASGEAHPDIVAALFDAGARVTANSVSFLTGKDGQQHPSIARCYLNHGLDPNSNVSNGEPLLRFMRNTACVHALLSRGADPNRCGPKGGTPLACALEYVCEDTSLFGLLVEYGAKLESNLLFEAIRPRGEGIFKTRFLLSKGLDPNTTSAEWGTPLHRAAYLAKEEVVKLLLEAGADSTARANCRQFKNQSLSEVAGERLQRDPDLQAPLQTILKLLGSYQG